MNKHDYYKKLYELVHIHNLKKVSIASIKDNIFNTIINDNNYINYIEKLNDLKNKVRNDEEYHKLHNIYFIELDKIELKTINDIKKQIKQVKNNLVILEDLLLTTLQYLNSKESILISIELNKERNK